jgi:hypothetical protein
MALAAAFRALVNELVRNQALLKIPAGDVVLAAGAGSGEPGRMH